MKRVSEAPRRTAPSSTCQINRAGQPRRDGGAGGGAAASSSGDEQEAGTAGEQGRRGGAGEKDLRERSEEAVAGGRNAEVQRGIWDGVVARAIMVIGVCSPCVGAADST